MKGRGKRRGSLVVVGVGINGPGQTTLDALECLRTADRLFYLGVPPATEYWLQRVNPSAASLADFYACGKSRATTYRQIAKVIVTAVEQGARVCAAFYGHPGVLVTSAHAAIAMARRRGYPARMLPGVAADACLFADLGLNPGDYGMQSYEATDFLLRRRRIDPTSPLLLWQPAHTGEIVSRDFEGASAHVKALTERLLRDYPPRHEVVLYAAPTFPGLRPAVRTIPLRRLPSAAMTSGTTLLIPPRAQRPPSATVLRWLDADLRSASRSRAGRRA